MFDTYLERWELVADGVSLRTVSSDLLPVLRGAMPAMLKVAREPEERRGNRLMAWWDGRGAAPVLAHKGDALLMERATSSLSLHAMATCDDDDEATQILCRVTTGLHSVQGSPPRELVSLAEWFAPLTANGDRRESWLDLAAATARALLQEQNEVVALHGDIHHGNVLDFGDRGWLAIDPKGLVGERAFDFVNMLRNPTPEVSLAPGRLARQAATIAAEAKVDRTRLLRWLLAFCGLSAEWLMEEDDSPDLDFAIARLAAAELGLVP